MNTGNIYWGGKGGRCVGLKTCHDIWETRPPVNLRACPDEYRDCFTVGFVGKVTRAGTG